MVTSRYSLLSSVLKFKLKLLSIVRMICPHATILWANLAGRNTFKSQEEYSFGKELCLVLESLNSLHKRTDIEIGIVSYRACFNLFMNSEFMGLFRSVFQCYVSNNTDDQ